MSKSAVFPARMESFLRYVDHATESGQRTIGYSRKATLERGDPRRLLTADDVEQDQHIQGRYSQLAEGQRHAVAQEYREAQWPAMRSTDAGTHHIGCRTNEGRVAAQRRPEHHGHEDGESCGRPVREERPHTLLLHSRRRYTT